MDMWTAYLVFVENQPGQWHVGTKKWGAPSVAVVDTEEHAIFIAKAPEMLQALRDLFEHCAMVHKHWGDGDNRQEADKAIENAQRLISMFEEV